MARPVTRASRPPSPRAVETAQRKERIVLAVTELATQGGYDAVQMRDVAAEAGVALGTLYRHYSSKDQLLIAALATQAETLRARLAAKPPVGPDRATRVTDALGRANRALERAPRASAAMVHALWSSDPATREVKLDVQREFIGIISTAIGTEPPGRPRDDAPAPADLDAFDFDAVTRVLGHVWFSTLGQWASGLMTNAEMTAELDAAVALLLR